MRRASCLTVLAVHLLAAGCGESAPKPAVAVPPAAPRPASGDATAPVGKTASQAVRARWSLESPTVIAYVDTDGLLRTKLAAGLVASLGAIVGDKLSPAQQRCMDGVVAGSKELAFGGGDGGDLAVLRYDPAALPLRACVEAQGEVTPKTVAGSKEAYALPHDRIVAVAEPGLLVAGSADAVAKALAGGNEGKALAPLVLRGDERAIFFMQSPEPSAARGTLTASDQRFALNVDAELPSDALAATIDTRATQLLAGARGMATKDDAEGAALGRVLDALQVTRDGKKLALAFDLRESPVEQARDLGTAAAVAVAAVRQYISRSKQAEATNVDHQLARDMATAWEREDATPRKKRKLASFPPVPKTVPRGTKYQSTPADWQPWSPLRFSMEMPQYFQYEVRAAKDGESAEILARGDLNGDGKTSLFRLKVHIKRADQTLAMDKIEETDPGE